MPSKNQTQFPRLVERRDNVEYTGPNSFHLLGFWKYEVKEGTFCNVSFRADTTGIFLSYIGGYDGKHSIPASSFDAITDDLYEQLWPIFEDAWTEQGNSANGGEHFGITDSKNQPPSVPPASELTIPERRAMLGMMTSLSNAYESERMQSNPCTCAICKAGRWNSND